MKPSVILVIAALLFSCIPSVSTRADEHAGPVPGLPWLHEGTVVTYRSYTAKLPGPMMTLKLDEKGGWMVNGKRYRQIGGEASDAAGLTQTVVVAIDGDDVVLKTMTFTLALGDPTRNAANQGGDTRFIAKARINTFCVAPEILAREVSDPDHGKIVTKLMWPVGNQLVEAIRIDKLSDAERLAVVYDSKTGIGLCASSVTPAGNSDSLLMQYDLVGFRDLAIPWAREKVPQAVRNMKSMRLVGQRAQEGPFHIRPTPFSVELTLTRCADTCANFDAVGSAQLPGMRQPVSSPAKPVYYGSADFGGLWIGPESAAHLQQGQVLDTDPNTRVKTTVSRMDEKTITLSQANRSTIVENTYDRTTGLILETSWLDTMSGLHTTLRRETVQ